MRKRDRYKDVLARKRENCIENENDYILRNLEMTKGTYILGWSEYYVG
jgi:hypothetical protein